MRALGTPSTDAALFKTILSEGDIAASDFQAASQAATSGNKADFLAAFAKLQAIPSHGRQFGFHSCDAQ